MEAKMYIKNISELKHYGNFKNSGFSLLNTYLKNLLNCKIGFNHQPVENFEKAMSIDLTSNIKRFYYTLDDNRIVLSIKVFDHNSKEIIAIMPVLLEGYNLASIDKYIFEQIASSITTQISKCYSNSFRGGTLYMGTELERLVITRCFTRGRFDSSRISFLISYIEKLSTSTFEGKFFSTGFILTRSLFDYKNGTQHDRNGVCYDLHESQNLVSNSNLNKRLWYLVDGKELFYLFDQNLVVRDAFMINNQSTSWKNYFDSYFLNDVLYGTDIVFRSISPNQVSIMNANSLEFVKIENIWKLRDYKYLSNFIGSKTALDEKVKSALIYYIAKCSRENVSSIIWIPKDNDDESIDKIMSNKNSMFSPLVSILSTNNEQTIMRILSSDGVTIIKNDGDIKYHGGIVELTSDLAKGLLGTGESAAKLLSGNGIAVKISQDGNIKIFYDLDEAPFVF